MQKMRTLSSAIIYFTLAFFAITGQNAFAESNRQKSWGIQNVWEQGGIVFFGANDHYINGDKFWLLAMHGQCDVAFPFLRITADGGNYDNLEGEEIEFRFQVDDRPSEDLKFHIYSVSKITGEPDSVEYIVTSHIRIVSLLYQDLERKFLELATHFQQGRTLSIQILNISPAATRLRFKRASEQFHISFENFEKTRDEARRICTTLSSK